MPRDPDVEQGIPHPNPTVRLSTDTRQHPPNGDQNHEQDFRSDSKIWPMYLKEASDEAKNRAEVWKTSLDSLLLFAGLFAGVVAGFIIESRQSLRLGDQEELLTKILAQMRKEEPPEREEPSHTVVSVNALWLSSLLTILFDAILAVLAKSWLVNFTPLTPRLNSDDAYRRWMLDARTEQWWMERVITLIPLLVQCAFFLFGAGLVVQIFSDYDRLGWLVLSFVAAAGVVYIVITCLPLVYGKEVCPFSTPLSDLLLLIPPWIKKVFGSKNSTSASKPPDQDTLAKIVDKVIESTNTKHVDEAIGELNIHRPHRERWKTLKAIPAASLRRIQSCIYDRHNPQRDVILSHHLESISQGIHHPDWNKEEMSDWKKLLEESLLPNHPLNRWNTFPHAVQPLAFSVRLPLLLQLGLDIDASEVDHKPWQMLVREWRPGHRFQIVNAACRGILGKHPNIRKLSTFVLGFHLVNVAAEGTRSEWGHVADEDKKKSRVLVQHCLQAFLQELAQRWEEELQNLIRYAPPKDIFGSFAFALHLSQYRNPETVEKVVKLIAITAQDGRHVPIEVSLVVLWLLEVIISARSPLASEVAKKEIAKLAGAQVNNSDSTPPYPPEAFRLVIRRGLVLFTEHNNIAYISPSDFRFICELMVSVVPPWGSNNVVVVDISDAEFICDLTEALLYRDGGGIDSPEYYKLLVELPAKDENFKAFITTGIDILVHKQIQSAERSGRERHRALELVVQLISLELWSEGFSSDLRFLDAISNLIQAETHDSLIPSAAMKKLVKVLDGKGMLGFQPGCIQAQCLYTVTEKLRKIILSELKDAFVAAISDIRPSEDGFAHLEDALVIYASELREYAGDLIKDIIPILVQAASVQLGRKSVLQAMLGLLRVSGDDENLRTSFETSLESVDLGVFSTIDSHEWKISFIQCLSEFLRASRKSAAQPRSTQFSDRLVEIIIDAAICDYDEDVCHKAFTLSVELIDYVESKSQKSLLSRLLEKVAEDDRDEQRKRVAEIRIALLMMKIDGAPESSQIFGKYFKSSNTESGSYDFVERMETDKSNTLRRSLVSFISQHSTAGAEGSTPHSPYSPPGTQFTAESPTQNWLSSLLRLAKDEDYSVRREAFECLLTLTRRASTKIDVPISLLLGTAFGDSKDPDAGVRFAAVRCLLSVLQNPAASPNGDTLSLLSSGLRQPTHAFGLLPLRKLHTLHVDESDSQVRRAWAIAVSILALRAHGLEDGPSTLAHIFSSDVAQEVQTAALSGLCNLHSKNASLARLVFSSVLRTVEERLLNGGDEQLQDLERLRLLIKECRIKKIPLNLNPTLPILVKMAISSELNDVSDSAMKVLTQVANDTTTLGPILLNICLTLTTVTYCGRRAILSLLDDQIDIIRSRQVDFGIINGANGIRALDTALEIGSDLVRSTALRVLLKLCRMRIPLLLKALARLSGKVIKIALQDPNPVMQEGALHLLIDLCQEADSFAKVKANPLPFLQLLGDKRLALPGLQVISLIAKDDLARESIASWIIASANSNDNVEHDISVLVLETLLTEKRVGSKHFDYVLLLKAWALSLKPDRNRSRFGVKVTSALVCHYYYSIFAPQPTGLPSQVVDWLTAAVFSQHVSKTELEGWLPMIKDTQNSTTTATATQEVQIPP
ncbi:hypothetical protein FA15DRAFT_708788 [Coprinopsis marcescibilis]|uniref:DUF6535 domain-containing protein n=1 Tax=Coprinopsis marcescibilis TaxID=230819 RepID=A0A5C3KUT6_COPMA|nr:hypothetical protein FA15DRAFT_708788 [Coprinopsis marcescibilis]